MGVLLTLGCYLIAFTPASFLFLRFIAYDPLRIILFVLGAFFWLCSLLLSGLVWFALYPFRDTLAISVVITIVFQEAARVLYFYLLKQAQHGLHKMVSDSGGIRLSGVSDLQNARHLLALVSGLGMGTLAALFLTMNVFASFSGSGTIGLPAALPESGAGIGFTTATRYLPIYYALSGFSLTLLHATWTIQMWDSCHKRGHDSTWWHGALMAIGTHMAVSALSFLNEYGYQLFVILTQAVILIWNIGYCYAIMGGTANRFGQGVYSALVSWAKLEWIRSKMRPSPSRNETSFANTVEVETEERVPNTASTVLST